MTILHCFGHWFINDYLDIVATEHSYKIPQPPVYNTISPYGVT